MFFSQLLKQGRTRGSFYCIYVLIIETAPEVYSFPGLNKQGNIA